MRRPPSADSRCGWQASLPPVVEGLFLDVVSEGFILYCCGDPAAPNALVASYEWDHCMDLIVNDADGSWTIHGLGAPGVRLTRDVMVTLAESIVARVR